MRTIRMIALAAIAVSAATCGGSGGSGPTGPGAGGGVAAGGGGTGGTDPYGGGTNNAGDNGCTTVAAGTVCLGNDLTFTPTSITVTHGSSVAFLNGSGMTHNVTFDPVAGAPANVADFSTGTRNVTFATAGTYNYHCSIHGLTMHGTVVVQ